MYHVHTSTLSSSTTTNEPVSALSPSVLFPFFQPSSSASLTSPSPTSPPTASSPGYHTTTRSSASSCPCHTSHVLPPSAAAPPQYITLPSANPHQSIILPLPQPSPPPAASHPASTPDASAYPSSSGAADAAPHTSPSESPLLVFSHGSTQVDTFVPSSQCLQRTLYSWSQLSDYTTQYCWNLPAASKSSTESSQAPGTHTGQPAGHNVSISNTNGRICQGDDVMKCTGHPWVNFSYHMQVKQWQERKEDAVEAAAAAAAVNPQPVVTTLPTHTSHHHHMPVKGLEVQVAQPHDILIDGVRRQRAAQQQQQQHQFEMDSDAGSMFDDDGDDASEDEDNWNELCSTTEDEDDCSDLTDIDM